VKITAKIFQEYDFLVAEIPDIDGVTYCNITEKIEEYVRDYMMNFGVACHIDRLNDNELLIEPFDDNELIDLIKRRKQ